MESNTLIARLTSGAKKLGDQPTPSQIDAVSELSQLIQEGTFCKNQALTMKIGGAAGALTAILSKENNTTSFDKRMEAAHVAAHIAKHDFSFAEMLVRAGIVKAVSLEAESPVLLNVLLVVIRGLTRGSREKMYEELMASGAAPKICQYLESPELNEGSNNLSLFALTALELPFFSRPYFWDKEEDPALPPLSSPQSLVSNPRRPPLHSPFLHSASLSTLLSLLHCSNNSSLILPPLLISVCARILGWVTSVPSCRERLRDLGLVPVIVAACRTCPHSKYHINLIMNLALSDSLLICLKDCDVLGVMQEILEDDHEEDADGGVMAHLNAVVSEPLSSPAPLPSPTHSFSIPPSFSDTFIIFLHVYLPLPLSTLPIHTSPFAPRLLHSHLNLPLRLSQHTRPL